MTYIWSRFFRRTTNLSLDVLPEEIIVDHIIARLTVKEILTVRRTNKALCAITKKPAVWKRFLPYLQSLQHPFASLPPTWKYNARTITSLELERLVTRAISLDNNWRGRNPRTYRELHCSTFDNVLDMVLLPGGHYLVTSVRDKAGRYSVIIWVMDHPATGRPSPIVFRQTIVRAYHLQAKYMTINGRKSLCVAFLRKRHKDFKDKRPIPVTVEMGSKEDDEDEWMPLKYECTTISVSLESLGLLSDSRYTPGTKAFENVARTVEREDPVSVISRIRTGRQLGAVSLDEIDGHAFVAVVKRPHRILLEELETNARIAMACQPNEEYSRQRQSIWNFRIIAGQFKILAFRVVRARRPQDPDTYLVEFFDIPDQFGEHEVHPHSSRFLQSKEKLLNVQIAELKTETTSEDESIFPSLANRPPPPISMYLRYDTGVDHVSIWPCARPLPPSPPPSPGSIIEEKPRLEYHYTLNDVESRTLDTKSSKALGEARIVPGAHRAFVYTVPPDHISLQTPVTGLFTYVYQGDEKIYIENSTAQMLIPDFEEQFADGMSVDEWTARENRTVLDREEERRRVIWPDSRKPINKKRQQLAVVNLQTTFADVLRKGISAITWDEDTGRVCITTDEDKQLHVLDFSCGRKPDADDNAICKEMDRMVVEERERMDLIRNPVGMWVAEGYLRSGSPNVVFNYTQHMYHCQY